MGYYKADVTVLISNKPIPINCRVPPVGAIVYYTHATKAPICDNEANDQFLQKLDKWLNPNILPNQVESDYKITPSNDSYGEEGNSEEVRLVVVGGFSTDEVRTATLNWAINKGVEVIDLSEENDEEDIRASEKYEENIDQKESKDSENKRVIEALQTVPWNAFETSVLKNREQNVEIEDKRDQTVDHIDGEFENLMSKLSTFKQKSDDLPREERYAYAEKVALSFFSAMGGDEETDSAE